MRYDRAAETRNGYPLMVISYQKKQETRNPKLEMVISYHAAISAHPRRNYKQQTRN
jgi:hypothetical protein